MSYILAYKFLQEEMVQPAFKVVKDDGIVNRAGIEAAIPRRLSAVPLLPDTAPDISVNMRGHVAAYASWLASGGKAE